MSKTALLAKPADPALNESSDVAELRAVIEAIIRREYSGDNPNEFWRAPARRAAERIVAALATMGPVVHGTGRP